jgi:RsiW-degrading membrane proteinase PrsW (M82 family)
MLWLFYLKKINIFKKPRWGNTFIVLLTGMLTTFLVFPLNDFMWDTLEYFPSWEPIPTLLHNIINIGIVEEFVKILPVLILLFFRRTIREPFDIIYYCSVSALGFSFIENLSYIETSSLYNTTARLFISTPAHMVFSSFIGYGLALPWYRKNKKGLLNFFIFFFIAAFAHGFFDFWIINGVVMEYRWITLLLFILCVYFWQILLNNTLNLSPDFKKETQSKNVDLKYYLLLTLTFVFMFSYLINSYTRGRETGLSILYASLISYGFFILYLPFTLSRFEFIAGYIQPLNIPLLALLRRKNLKSELTGRRVNVRESSLYRLVEKHDSLSLSLPVSGILEQKIIVEGSRTSFLVVLDKPIHMEGYENNRIIIMPKPESRSLAEPGNVLIHFYMIRDTGIPERPSLSWEDFEFAGWAISRIIEEQKAEPETEI